MGAVGPGTEAANPAVRGWEWGFVALLGLTMLAQMWLSVRQLSATSDEMDHLHAGYRYWQCNDFGWNPEHPPLAKLVAAAPLLAMRIKDPVPQACGLVNSKRIDFEVGHDFVFANPESMLLAARAAMMFFPLLLLASSWLLTRRMFGAMAAALAATLVAFDPNLLAHGPIIATDLPAAAGIVLTILALYAFVCDRTPVRFILLAAATGFALCLKHSTVFLLPIIGFVLVVDSLADRESSGRRILRAIAASCVVAGIAVVLLWGVYGFRYAARPNAAAAWTTPRLTLAQSAMSSVAIPALERARVLPQSYLIGLQDVVVESATGRTSFVLGRVYATGQWFYFPVAIVVKFTLALLVMILLSALALPFWKQHGRELVFLLVPAGTYFAMSMASGMNLGIRHVLPVLPLMIIFAAAGTVNLASGRRWQPLAVTALLLFHVASSLHAYPDYLSYSNEAWGGPANTYKYLADSNADWGQGLKMASAYVRSVRPGSCWVLSTYNDFNTDYGIPCHEISSFQREVPPLTFTGTVIASSSVVDGITSHAGGMKAIAIFRGHKPKTELAGSAMLVYEGTFDFRPIAAAQLFELARAALFYDPQLAMEHATQIVEIDPADGRAHAILCQGHGMLGDMEGAERECNIALALLEKDPAINASEVRSLADMMKAKGLRVHPGDPLAANAPTGANR